MSDFFVGANASSALPSAARRAKTTMFHTHVFAAAVSSTFDKNQNSAEYRPKTGKIDSKPNGLSPVEFTRPPDNWQPEYRRLILSRGFKFVTGSVFCWGACLVPLNSKLQRLRLCSSGGSLICEASEAMLGKHADIGPDMCVWG